MGRSIPPLQQLPHGLIENRIAPQRQHITHGKHITHDNQHINKQHEHQPIGEAMTNHHAEDGDKKSILDARIERAYANEYDAAFAAATIKNYASLPLATILADHPQLLKRCTKIMGDPDIRKLTDPYAPKRDNDSYVLTVGCLAHMLTALDTKLKLEWEPDERHELESKRNTLRTALFLPLDGLKRCNVELNTQARQKPGTTGQKTPRPHAAIVDRNRYNRMTAHFSAEGAAIRTLIDLLCLLSINELFEGYLALVPATAPKSVAKIIETCRRQFERHRNGSEMNASIAQYYAAHYKNDGCAPVERHELESKRNTLRTALFLPLDGLKRCNVELNTQARQKPGTTGQKTPRPHAAIVDRNRYNRMTAHFSAEGAAIRTLIDLLCLLSINELFEGYLALVPATAPKSVAKIIETCRRQFERHRNGSEMNASIAQYYAAHYKNDGCAPVEHQLRLAYTTPVATLHRFGVLGACEPHEQAACPTTELDLRLGRTL